MTHTVLHKQCFFLLHSYSYSIELTGFISPGLESTTAMSSSSHLIASMNSPCTTTPSCMYINSTLNPCPSPSVSPSLSLYLYTPFSVFIHLWFFQSLVYLPFFLLHCCVVVFLLVSILRQRSEFEAQLIDRQIVLPGVVLEGASEKALREEEPRQPEGLGVAVFNPVLRCSRQKNVFVIGIWYPNCTSTKCMRKVRSFTHELRGLRDGYAAFAHKPGTCRQDQSKNQIHDFPLKTDLVVEKACVDSLQFFRHYH